MRTPAEGDRDQGHDTFREGGADCGEDGAHGDRADVELHAEPLDGVDEPLAGQVDDHSAAKEQDNVDHGIPLVPREENRVHTALATSTHGDNSPDWIEGLAHPQSQSMWAREPGNVVPSMSTTR